MTMPGNRAATKSETLAGRVALITGASGGIGQALGRRLAAGGARLALAYGANGAPAMDLAAEIIAAGGHAVPIQADLRSAEAPAALIEATEDKLGPVDVLVSNAGLGRRQSLEEIASGDFDDMIAVNLRSPFLLAQQVVPGMRERGFGRILFVSSVAAFTGGSVGPHYAASKAGLHGLTHYLAVRLAGHGISVNALAPALVTGTAMLPGDPEELRARIPVGRLGRPEEVADLAAAILGNAYLTNQVIGLDGGIYPR
jgi:3-oxoacyl-[acyl-carrier protein] reductase